MSSLHAFLNRTQLWMGDYIYSPTKLRLWSPLSFPPQKCCFCYSPFGYIHRHTCAPVLYKKQMCALCKYRYTQSLIHTSIYVRKQNREAVYRLFSADSTSAAQMCTAVWGAAVYRMFCIPPCETWGVPVGRPSGCISLCVIGICLPLPLVGCLQGFGHVCYSMLIRGRCGDSESGGERKLQSEQEEDTGWSV